MHTITHASREAVAEWLTMNTQSLLPDAQQARSGFAPQVSVWLPHKGLRMIGSILFGALVLVGINGVAWFLPARITPILSYEIPRTMQWIPDQPVAMPVHIPLREQFHAVSWQEVEAQIASLFPDLRNTAYNRQPGVIINPFVVEHRGQCTSYVWGRYYELTGKNLAKAINRDAGFWAMDARSVGYRVDNVPSAHAIAVWQKQGAPRGTGHVAFVEAVLGDTVLVSEANWIQQGERLIHRNGYALRYSATASMERRGFTFLGYIHLEDGAPVDRLLASAR